MGAHHYNTFKTALAVRREARVAELREVVVHQQPARPVRALREAREQHVGLRLVLLHLWDGVFVPRASSFRKPCEDAFMTKTMAKNSKQDNVSSKLL